MNLISTAVNMIVRPVMQGVCVGDFFVINFLHLKAKISENNKILQLDDRTYSVTCLYVLCFSATFI
jgi:hypothetical protein